MILICDYCGIGKQQIFKIPSSLFYIENAALVTKNDYINMCEFCLVHEKERQQ